MKKFQEWPPTVYQNSNQGYFKLPGNISKTRQIKWFKATLSSTTCSKQTYCCNQKRRGLKSASAGLILTLKCVQFSRRKFWWSIRRNSSTMNKEASWLCLPKTTLTPSNFCSSYTVQFWMGSNPFQTNSSPSWSRKAMICSSLLKLRTTGKNYLSKSFWSILSWLKRY